MVDRMGSFLHELRGNAAGNTLAIAAAALVPLVGMVGGAVDISRYYMATARMQNACDAGALAARKQMEDDNFETEDEEIGLRFFDQNYPDGTFGLENLNRTYTADAEGTVTGTATGEMPTTIMQIFGKEGMDIAVSCSAEINISNTDIMFVLDVTGSMNCPDDGSWCPNSNNNNVEANNARIRGLRTAVVNFYDAVEDATSDAAQVRYGIVPYASNVNVGASIPTQYLATLHTYQSREADEPHWEEWWETLGTNLHSFTDAGPEEYEGETEWDRVYRIDSDSECEDAMEDPIDPYYVDGSIDEDTVELIDQEISGDIRTRQIQARATLRRGEPDYDWNGRRDRCNVFHDIYEFRADITITIVDRWREEMVFDDWIYKPVEYNVSAVLAGGTFMAPIARDGNYLRDVEISWNNGCIEEAVSVRSDTWDPIPEGAYDLDINLKPTINERKWKPMLRDLVWKREDGGNHYDWLYQSWDENRPPFDCPKEAFRLTEIERDDLESYLLASNGFIARSNTYHDIGMIWGARFISPRGIFQDDNEAAPNGDTIARHIVFMTDGVLMVDDEIYGTYGIEWWDRRVTNGTNSSAAHAARFQAACRQAREENIAVWVVAFGTSLTQNLIDCATPGRAYAATDGDSLNAAFQEIAQKIAALRLTS